MKTIFRVSRAFKRDPGFQEKPGLSRETQAFKRDPGRQERAGLSREIRAVRRGPGFQERSGLSRETPGALKREPLRALGFERRELWFLSARRG